MGNRPDGKPHIIYLAICSECGGSSLINAVGSTPGAHGINCPWFPLAVGQEPGLKNGADGNVYS